MIGPLVNGAAVIVGSVGGALLGHKVPLTLRRGCSEFCVRLIG